MQTTPYTYLIGWSAHNKYYYGVRYAKNCHPSDLWMIYFTSSKFVSEMRTIHGEPNIIEVRKTFTTGEDALVWEQNVLRRLNAISSEKWINCGIGGAWYIKKQTPEHIAKRTSGMQGKTAKARSASLANVAKAKYANTGRKQKADTQAKKRNTYKQNWDKNQISAQRDPWVIYRIEGTTFVGNRAVMEAFGVTEPTIYNRVKNPKFDWERMDG